MDDKINLYSPYSLVPQLRGHQLAIVYWFRTDREKLITEGSNLIQEYALLTSEERLCAERMVKGFLTEEEVSSLSSYLSEHLGYKIISKKLPLPISGVRVEKGKRRPVIPFEKRGETSDSGFIRLEDQKGYSLAFKACGYITGPSAI